MQVHQFPCLDDNYGFLAHDPETGETAAIDTPDGAKYLEEATRRGWTITQVWNTHWHPDHAGGNDTIVRATGAKIVAPRGEGGKINPIDIAVQGGDTVKLGRFTATVIDVPGHTLGHIAYHVPAAGLAFVGDALFALGCGRMFEGNPQMMWDSLSRLKALPPETVIYCAHEYTKANARFAVTVDPDNAALQAYADDIAARRDAGEWTVPTVLQRELATNPFLRADQPALQGAMGHPGDAVATFAEIRRRKDTF